MNRRKRKNLQISKNKTLATIIAIILLSSMAFSMNALSTVNAAGLYPIPGHPTDSYDLNTYTAVQQGMYWNGMVANASATRILLWTRFHDMIPTHSFMMIAPNPVGVGQSFNVVMFNPQVPPNALLVNNIRYQFKIAVVKPDNSIENLPATGTSSGNVGGGQGGASGGVYFSDSTGSTYTAYTPDQIGNYTLTVYYQQLQYLWNSTVGGGSNDYYGVTFLASNFTTTVTVQQQPVMQNGLENIPALPTEYWTRPIEGQNTNWYVVSSNWLSDSHDRDNGGMENRFQPDGTAPNSSHILWTRPTEDNGILGGTNEGRTGLGNAFNAGSQYQPRNLNPIIMYGRLYYCPNIWYTGQGDFMDCVDLKTGQLIYEVNTTALVGSKFSMTSYTTSTNPSNSWFGYYYSQDDPNQHGIVTPGWLFTPDYRRSLQPERGIPSIFNITNVPSAVSSVEIQGPAGENLRYVLVNKGNTTNPSWYLSQWNSSRVIPASSDGGTMNNIDASTANRFDWNVSLSWSFATSPTIRAAKLGDILFGSNGSWPSASGSPSYAYPDNVTVWAISLNTTNTSNPLGSLLYMKTIPVDDVTLNTNYLFERASAAEGVFVANEVPLERFHVYDMRTGNELFKTDIQADLNPYGYFTWPSQIAVTQTKLAYGLLFTAGYVGSVSAYNLTTGQLQWRQTFPSGGEKINDYVQMEALIADGKIFVGTHEHSADTPLYKGEHVHAFNAYTGEIIWDMASWGYPETFATADGVLIYWNNYDAQVYALGKGPSSTTVQAPLTSITAGDKVVIQGTVMDISAGTKQKQQAADHPNGVAAVSDASMSSWMEYIYMQKTLPTNTTGVPVSLDAVDPNGNYIHIGTATSDTQGLFHYTWNTPNVPGDYSVFASFAGTESYWPSNAETAMVVGQAPSATASPQPQAALPPLDMYLLYATIAIIAAIAIVGILLLRKRP
jgi:outer membrane protein assembly factor BamB